jgi:hypothetical protein
VVLGRLVAKVSNSKLLASRRSESCGNWPSKIGESNIARLVNSFWCSSACFVSAVLGSFDVRSFVHDS